MPRQRILSACVCFSSSVKTAPSVSIYRSVPNAPSVSIYRSVPNAPSVETSTTNPLTHTRNTRTLLCSYTTTNTHLRTCALSFCVLTDFRTRELEVSRLEAGQGLLGRLELVSGWVFK